MISRLRRAIVVLWPIVVAGAVVALGIRIVQQNLPLRSFDDPTSIRLPSGVSQLAQWESRTESSASGAESISLVRLIQVPEVVCMRPSDCVAFASLSARFSDASGGSRPSLVESGPENGFISSSRYLFEVADRGIVRIFLVDPSVNDAAVRLAEPDAGSIPHLNRCRSSPAHFRCVVVRYG